MQSSIDDLVSFSFPLRLIGLYSPVAIKATGEISLFSSLFDLIYNTIYFNLFKWYFYYVSIQFTQRA
nr:MAG TPA: hypothetical protein [Caudoviricetes sp.]